MDDDHLLFTNVQGIGPIDIVRVNIHTGKVDFLSNGFKCYGANSVFNGSGNSYTYMAFAEAPFVNSNGVPCNAR